MQSKAQSSSSTGTVKTAQDMKKFMHLNSWWLLGGAAVILATFFFDNALLRRGVGLRFSWLDGVMLYLTDFGLVFFCAVIITGLLLQKKLRWLAMLALSLAFSFEISYLLKLIFQTPRPYFSLEIAIIPLTQAAGYSFPSLHSAVCLGILPFIGKIFTENYQRIIGVVVLLVIAYSRAYLGVHYFSDILVGGLIGYLISKIAIFVEDHYNFVAWFTGHIKNKLELRRQIAHIIIGMSIVFLIDLKLLTVNILGIILLLGVALSFAYRYHPIPIIHEMLHYFERERDINVLPGKGPIFLVFGALLAMLIFPIDIAKGAITVLAIGDSVSHLVGRYFGSTKVPFTNKMLEGTIVAIVFSTLAALLFVDFEKAFLASLLTVSFESIYPDKMARVLDDNLIIPLMAGAIMLMV